MVHWTREATQKWAKSAQRRPHVECQYALSRHDVQYLIIGGEAVIYYGHIRLTGDVDFFYNHSEENAERLYEALIHFWDGNIPGIKSKHELAKPEYVIQFGIPPNRIDLVADIDGVEFEEAWKAKKTELLQMHDQQVAVYFLSLKHLIKNKEQAGRPKDLEDLKYLRRVDS